MLFIGLLVRPLPLPLVLVDVVSAWRVFFMSVSCFLSSLSIRIQGRVFTRVRSTCIYPYMLLLMMERNVLMSSPYHPSSYMREMCRARVLHQECLNVTVSCAPGTERSALSSKRVQYHEQTWGWGMGEEWLRHASNLVLLASRGHRAIRREYN